MLPSQMKPKRSSFQLSLFLLQSLLLLLLLRVVLALTVTPFRTLLLIASGFLAVIVGIVSMVKIKQWFPKLPGVDFIGAMLGGAATMGILLYLLGCVPAGLGDETLNSLLLRWAVMLEPSLRLIKS